MTDPNHEIEIDEVRESRVITGRFIQLPLALIHAISHAFLYWWFTRHWVRILQGLPALVVAGLILLPIALHGWNSQDRLVFHYRREANRAVAQNDHEAADLCLQKLLQYNALDPTMHYAMAMVASRKGETERATTILTALAADENGDPRAHLWKAKQIASGY